MRKKIYEIIELSGDGGKLSGVYDFMMITIVISIVPFAFG